MYPANVCLQRRVFEDLITLWALGSFIVMHSSNVLIQLCVTYSLVTLWTLGSYLVMNHTDVPVNTFLKNPHTTLRASYLGRFSTFLLGTCLREVMFLQFKMVNIGGIIYVA